MLLVLATFGEGDHCLAYLAQQLLSAFVWEPSTKGRYVLWTCSWAGQSFVHNESGDEPLPHLYCGRHITAIIFK